jgi:hypothetical protein
VDGKLPGAMTCGAGAGVVGQWFLRDRNLKEPRSCNEPAQAQEEDGKRKSVAAVAVHEG